MFSAFFGQYLLKKGIVNGPELSKVLSRQDTIRLKLGVLAVNAKFMTAAQAEEVHELQVSLDRRFGEIATMKKYLSDDQLCELLTMQKSEHLILAQALIDDKIMSMETFEKEIDNYKNDYGLDDEQFEAFQKGDVKVVITAFMAFEKNEMSSFYIDYVTLFVKNLIRFIDTNVSIDRVEKVSSIKTNHHFTQNITAASPIYTGYSGDIDAILDIASKHAEESFSELGEYPIDSACEFLNLTNGLFVVNMSDLGQEMGLTIQSYEENLDINPPSTMYHVPIRLTSGLIDLYIGKA